MKNDPQQTALGKTCPELDSIMLSLIATLPTGLLEGMLKEETGLFLSFTEGDFGEGLNTNLEEKGQSIYTHEILLSANDLESIAGQVATGCNVIYFTTGNGSITNFPFVPTIKIVSTSRR